jgi:hypothetical protein
MGSCCTDVEVEFDNFYGYEHNHQYLQYFSEVHITKHPPFGTSLSAYLLKFCFEAWGKTPSFPGVTAVDL